MVDGCHSGDPPDETLIRRWADGDIDAFDTLYGRYRQALYRFIAGQCLDTRVVEELFQDVWSRVVAAVQGGQLPRSFRPWVYRVARNRLTDHYRRAGRTPDDTSGDADASLVDDTGVAMAAIGLEKPLQPDELASLAERRDSLDASLQTLPAAQREVLLLKYVAGMTLGEIADALALKPETAKSRIRYAINQLRRQLREPL